MQLLPATKERLAEIDDWIGSVSAVAQARYGGGLRGTEEDLALIQRLLDDRALDENQLLGLGLAFGRVLQRRTGWKWAIAEDDQGEVEAGSTVRDGLLAPILVAPVNAVAGDYDPGKGMAEKRVYSFVNGGTNDVMSRRAC